jgi:hypothetical protein
MYGRFTILSVLMGASLTACSFEQAGPEDGADASQESVGSVSAAFNVTAKDRQPAAVVIRTERGTLGGLPRIFKTLYVFMCDNHQIKVRTKGIAGWNLGWQSVAPDYPCDSAPSVGVIHNTEANKLDTLGVYWRSGESLIEAWYNKNNVNSVHNLLEENPAQVPPIAGSPQVTDTSDPTKIQVVVKRSADNQIWTIAWTGSAYAPLPVKRANGTTFTTSADDVYTMYNAGYGRAYISIEDITASKHIIFARPDANWGTSFTEYATSSIGVNGMLSIGGSTSSLKPNCQSGFAMRRDAPGIIFGQCLDTGGNLDLPNWEQVSVGQDATLYGAPEANTNYLFGPGNGTIWYFTASPLTAQGTLPWGATGMASAMVQVKGGAGYVFWAKNVGGVNHLMVADYSASTLSNATVTDLGGSLIY